MTPEQENEIMEYRLLLDEENQKRPLERMLAVDEMTDEQIWEHLQSRRWLEEHAREIEHSYEDLIEAAERYLDYGEYLRGGSELEGIWTPDEFWGHFGRVSGRVVDIEHSEIYGYYGGNFYSCSC